MPGSQQHQSKKGNKKSKVKKGRGITFFLIISGDKHGKKIQQSSVPRLHRPVHRSPSGRVRSRADFFAPASPGIRGKSFY
jgi:hypothetical protein